MTEPIREALQRIVELVHKYRALHALPDTSEWLEAVTAAEYALFQTNPIKEWDAVYHAAAQLDPIACCLSELHVRVAALEAMAKTVAMVVPTTGPALVLPDDAFQSLETAAAHPAPAAKSAVWVGTAADVAPQLVPTTTADNLSPVEPAPQAPQGVTVEELAYIPSEAPSGDLGAAYWLLKHPRLGPLLRGEGAPAPKRVVLPEEPPAPVSNPKWFFAGDFRYVQGRRDGWKAAYTEVERQQGGQADG